MRAAHAVTTGTYSPGTAAHTFCVDRDCLRYYRKKLLDSGFDELHASVSAGTTSASAPVEEPAIASNVDEWELYCDAYMHAGMLINKKGMSRRKAAKVASEKYKVEISASSALRAAACGAERPKRTGRQLYLGYETEYRLETLCLVLREMRIPIFQCMVLNYANQLIKGTAVAEQFKHGEVRRVWYYNWLSWCKRLKTGNIRPLEMSRAK